MVNLISTHSPISEIMSEYLQLFQKHYGTTPLSAVKQINLTKTIGININLLNKYELIIKDKTYFVNRFLDFFEKIF